MQYEFVKPILQYPVKLWEIIMNVSKLLSYIWLILTDATHLTLTLSHTHLYHILLQWQRNTALLRFIL